jgi:multicomponent Na+:H+ antiporter subunit F
MIGEGLSVLAVGLYGAMALQVAALFVALLRLIWGPSTPDRVVALDLMGTIAVGVIGCYTVITDQRELLLAAAVLALLAFLATVAFARYLERKATR